MQWHGCADPRIRIKTYPEHKIPDCGMVWFLDKWMCILDPRQIIYVIGGVADTDPGSSAFLTPRSWILNPYF
jgi:hypothetical protein